jgi:hypothetical protein
VNFSTINSALVRVMRGFQVTWHLRYPLILMAILIAVPCSIFVIPRFVETALVANTAWQIGSLVFICLTAASLAIFQVSYLVNASPFRKLGEEWDHSQPESNFKKNPIEYIIDSLTASKPHATADHSFVKTQWNWKAPHTLVLLFVGIFPASICFINSSQHSIPQAAYDVFNDESPVSFYSFLLGLASGFVAYLVMLQVMASIQSLFIQEEVETNTSVSPLFKYHPVSAIFPIKLWTHKQNYIRQILEKIGAKKRHRTEAYLWIAVIVFLYLGVLFMTSGDEVIDSEHDFTVLFYLILWILLIEVVFSAFAYVFDKFNLPFFILVLLAFFLSPKLYPFGHHFQTFVFDKSKVSGTAPQTVSGRESIKDNPLKIIVLAPGGGIHAAAWTGTVLAGLHERYPEKFAKSLYLVSAVSGGSVGAMNYIYNFESLVSNSPKKNDSTTPTIVADYRAEVYESALNKVRRRSSTSSLESIFWGITYPDTARIFLPWMINNDRGDVQETVFKSRLDNENPTLMQWHHRAKAGRMPYVVFNATEAETGKRVLFSTLPRPNPNDDQDIRNNYNSSHWKPKDFLLLSDNRIDIPISTAVRLSATFPYISPASKPKKDSGIELGHVVDGGYADNEGILTAIEEINRILFNEKASKQSRTEKIIFIRIDHGMTDTAKFSDSQTIANSSGIGYSIFGPVLAAFNVRDTSQQERSEVELEILRKNLNQGGDPSNPKDPKIKFVEVSLRFQDNGSLKVPPLNWKLLPDQRILYTTAWEELIEDSYSPQERMRKVHTGIRVLDELLK